MIIQLQNLQWGKGEDDVFAGVPIGGGEIQFVGKAAVWWNCNAALSRLGCKGPIFNNRLLGKGYASVTSMANLELQSRPPRLLTHFELLSSIDTFVGHGDRQQNVQLV
jgi:hypothetical protein